MGRKAHTHDECEIEEEESIIKNNYEQEDELPEDDGVWVLIEGGS